MKKLVTAAAFVAFMGLATAAHGATLDVTLGSSLSYGVSGLTLSPNINLATDSNLTLINSQVLPAGAAPGAFVQPSGTLSNNNFLGVYGPDQSHPSGTNGLAVFNLAGGGDYFGFTWGTIDRYNSVTLTDSANNTFVITGSDILNHIAHSHAGRTQEDVVFNDPFGSILSAVLTSSRNAFEAANFESGEAPLPSALVLFGSALLAFCFIARKRRTA